MFLQSVVVERARCKIRVVLKTENYSWRLILDALLSPLISTMIREVETFITKMRVTNARLEFGNYIVTEG